MGKIIDYDIEYDPDYGYYRNYSKSLKVISEVAGENNNNDSFKVCNLEGFKEKSSIDNKDDGNENSRHVQLEYNHRGVYTGNENVLKTRYIKYDYFYKLYNKEIIYCEIKYNFIDFEKCTYGNSL